jgi:hypothetical protein
VRRSGRPAGIFRNAPGCVDAHAHGHHALDAGLARGEGIALGAFNAANEGRDQLVAQGRGALDSRWIAKGRWCVRRGGCANGGGFGGRWGGASGGSEVGEGRCRERGRGRDGRLSGSGGGAVGLARAPPMRNGAWGTARPGGAPAQPGLDQASPQGQLGRGRHRPCSAPPQQHHASTPCSQG